MMVKFKQFCVSCPASRVVTEAQMRDGEGKLVTWQCQKCKEEAEQEAEEESINEEAITGGEGKKEGVVP